MINVVTNPIGIWLWPALIWTIILKGFGLWRSGRNNQPAWFIAMLILNTLGILPIFYLLFFQPKKKKATPSHKEEEKFKKLARQKALRRKKSFKKELKRK